MSVGGPQRQIGDHYKIRADVMAEMVKLDQEQRAEIARLRDVNTDLQAQIVRMEAVVQAAREIRAAAVAMSQCGQTGGNAWKLALEQNRQATAALFAALKALDDHH